MRALLIEEPGKHGVTDLPDPEPGPRDVVVEVAAVGICGTDLHVLAGEFEPTRYPIVPGHEFAGTVVAVGSEVTTLAEGDRVAVDPTLNCRECRACMNGHGNLCENWNAMGVAATNGAMSQYVAAPVRNCYLLDPGVDLRQAALIEPLSCAVHGYDLLPRRLGEHYLIYGAGTMGLMMLQLAPSAGAVTTTVVDLNEDRLQVAAQLGAGAVARTVGDLPAEWTRERGWDVVVDATGVVAAIEDGLTRVARGGTFQQFGVADVGAKATMSPFRIYNDEVHVVGSMAVLHSYGRAVELFAAGVLDADTMITGQYALDDFDQAVEAFKAGQGRKLQILPGT